MEPQKTQSPDLLTELSSEVSQESAPLLDFITKHGGKIAAVVLLFLLATGASALWHRHSNKSSEELLLELAKASLQTDKGKAAKDCQAITARAPQAMHSLVYLTVGDLETQNNDLAHAVHSFASAAKADSEGTTGRMATLAQVNTLLRMGEAKKALALLDELKANLGSTQPRLLTQLEAEAALMSGDTARAARVFAQLSKEYQGVDADFYRARATALGYEADAPHNDTTSAQ